MRGLTVREYNGHSVQLGRQYPSGTGKRAFDSRLDDHQEERDMNHPRCVMCGVTMSYLSDVIGASGNGRSYRCPECGRKITVFPATTPVRVTLEVGHADAQLSKV